MISFEMTPILDICEHLGFGCEVAELPERELKRLIQATIKNISAYDRGVALREGHGWFRGTAHLAQEISGDVKKPMHARDIYNSIRIAELPETVLDAFESRGDIKSCWARALYTTVNKNPDIILYQSKAIKKLRAEGKKMTAREIYLQLVSTKI